MTTLVEKLIQIHKKKFGTIKENVLVSWSDLLAFAQMTDTQIAELEARIEELERIEMGEPE